VILMGKGPVPEGASVADDDARTARHAARDDIQPDWLDEGLPPDIEDGDERDWPGEAAEIAAQAAVDQAEQDQIRARLLAHGGEHGYAHFPGAPSLPGVKTGPGGGFGQDEPLDLAAPDPALAMQADYASGSGRDFTGVGDDELFGLLGARRKLHARQAWERLAVIAELIRRRPAPHVRIHQPSGMPAVWAEGTTGELTVQLAITRRAAQQLLALAWDLWVKLPATSRMLRAGVIDEDKAATVASYCANLTPEQSRQAEQILFSLDDVEMMTWGMIRDRIARAVMEVDPDAARKRREDAAKQRRVEVRAEESGNAMICGRELPPAAVLALDRKLTARAKQLRRLGVPGDMDELRALAFLERWDEADPVGDLIRNRDDGDEDRDGDGSEGGGTDPSGPDGPSAPAGGGVSGTIHLTAPVTTLTDMAGRPGSLRGAGPIDPDLTRDLAETAARNGKTVYEFTLTDPAGRPVAHACGTPGPGDQSTPDKPGKPVMSLIDRGPPGSHGTWRYTHHRREIIFEFEDLSGPCDHKHRADGHDPGKLLRHLTGVLNQTCTHPACRRPEAQCDFEHSRPHDQDGITCLCNCGPVCRSDHRDKQRPGWKLEHAGARGWFRWTTPSGRTYLSKPTIYPI